MLSSAPVSQSSVVWDKKTIVEDGINFLNNKNETLNKYRKLWHSSMGLDYYSSSSVIAADRLKTNAENSKREIEILNTAVTTVLDEELSKDASSAEAKELLKISLATTAGLNYFTHINKNIYSPASFLNWGLKEGRLISNKLMYSAFVFTTAAGIAQLFSSYKFFSNCLIGLEASFTFFVAAHAISHLNRSYRIEPAEEENANLKRIFEKALGSQPKI